MNSVKIEVEEPHDMKVGELSRRCGVSIRTVWRYLSRGILTPRKDLNGVRWYSWEDYLLLKSLIDARE